MTSRLSRLARDARALAAAAALALAMIIVPWQDPLAQTATTPTQAAAQSLLLVLNKAENSLAMVDPSTMQVVARVPVGVGPHEVATSADERRPSRTWVTAWRRSSRGSRSLTGCRRCTASGR